ncbi:pilus assembly protein PilC [Acinetobacter sp. c3-l95]|uniref:pilus assembly protein PilC n=1 Tax=Acinetobacter sp. c3-l95 TaxID=3342804 RepID=UPI0035B96195
MIKLNRKALVASVSGLMTLGIVASIPATHASDIEIYKLPEQGKKTILMMLDTSGSMTSCDLPKGSFGNNNSSGWLKNGANGIEDGWSDDPNSFYGTWCTIQGSSKRYYDRITNLKSAIFTLMDDPSINESVTLGIGQFTPSYVEGSPFPNDNTTGKIIIPAKAIDNVQRNLIKDTIRRQTFKASSVTPTANAYAEAGAYMLGTNTTMTDFRYKGFSGFSQAAPGSTLNGNYISPLPSSGQECGGQAIYYLTDGVPNMAPAPQHVMNKALGSKGFRLDLNYTGLDQLRDSIGGVPPEYQEGGMLQVGEFAKRLRDPMQNPKGISIKTAVVGFGNEFQSAIKNKEVIEGVTYYNCSEITNKHIKNACNWGAKKHPEWPGKWRDVGGYGEGGFYYAANNKDVVESIHAVIGDIKPNIPAVVTGAPTIPLDPLNPQRYLSDAYYANFAPKPHLPQQLWVGNLDKYRVKSGALVDKSDDNQKLIDTAGKFNSNAQGQWSSGSEATGNKITGVKDNIPLRLIADKSNFARKVLTNRSIGTNTAAQTTANLARISLTELNTGKFRDDPKKNYWLNILGYGVSVDSQIAIADLEKSTTPAIPTMRQLASTMHSSPVLFTRDATYAANGALRSRTDYMLFGSTDGMLHVVNNSNGKEVFAFVPNEFMENAPQAFLREDLTGTGGPSNLHYGIDGAWTVHSQYVESSNTNGERTLTVSDSGRREGGENSQSIKGLQWAYGGLRMGGNSYYALDVSDINNPMLHFHIDPKNSKVYYGKYEQPKSFPELAKMGQSWSKPTIGYVNWGVNEDGKPIKKLVMFVGGGYDKGYEQTDYKQPTTGTNASIGAGVYMFDAENGDLLWWSSANSVTTASKGVKYTSEPQMQYSVVSRINAIDRNGDGLIDNLYFGDLGGQAFRVDLDNNVTRDTPFGSQRVQRLFSEHQTDGTSPRFYEMPSVSVHIEQATNNGDGKRFAVIAFSSGDRSSPFTAGTTQKVGGGVDIKPTAKDGVFVYYDNDIGRNDLFASSFVATALSNVALQEVVFTEGVKQTSLISGERKYNRGWKHTFSQVAGLYKGIGEPYAVANFLYTNVYNKDGVGVSGECGGGVRGNSEVKQYCLPTGKCDVAVHGFAASPTNGVGSGPTSSPLGAGIIGATGGGGFTTDDRIGNVAGNRNGLNCSLPENKVKPLCQEATVTAGIQNLRWFESK